MSVQTVVRLPLMSPTVGSITFDAHDDHDFLFITIGDAAAVKVKKMDLFAAVNLIMMGDTSQPRQQVGIGPRFP